MHRTLDQFPLRRGAHRSRDDGMCAMEMVAWLAGEDHSDEPRCACPTIAALVRALNDSLLSDAARDRWLRPLVPCLVNTRRGASAEQRRGLLVADAVVRVFLPMLLERDGREAEARGLRQLPPVADADAAAAALRAVETWAPDVHAARWLLQRLIEGTAPARYVAGAVQLVRWLGDAPAWAAAAALIGELAAVGPGIATGAAGMPSR